MGVRGPPNWRDPEVEINISYPGPSTTTTTTSYPTDNPWSHQRGIRGMLPHLDRLVSDPELNTQQLNDQLRALGLYAAPTLGDGNCLFRALSDQCYGSPSQHLKLRDEICDWMAAHKERYEPFVEDDRGFDVHLTCMRQPGTYGGHLELSAFAHLKRRNVKVVQPGLVYVIEWSTGNDPLPASPTSTRSGIEEPSLSSRDKRHLIRSKNREQKEVTSDDEDAESLTSTVYVAYHDWEHFSSVRNLSGPHSGLPCVVERPSPAAGTPIKSKPTTKVALKSAKRTSTERAAPPPRPRSPSLAPSSDASTSSSNAPSQREPTHMRTGLPNLILRDDRSPKRTFDESSGTSGDNSEEMSQGNAKRTRSARRMAQATTVDVDADADTPSLSASGSSPSSAASSPAPTPPPAAIPAMPKEKPLTRRQRKQLGLPKPRPPLLTSSTAPKGTAGKILIPGGRYKKAKDAGMQEQPEDAAADEWRSNGNGRLDVRGFRELKI